MCPPLRLRVDREILAICRLDPDAALPSRLCFATFWSLTRTPDELTLVCPQWLAPDDVQHHPGWLALTVAGPLDLDMTGVMASLSSALAAAEVSLFAVSTYDTDHLLVRVDQLQQAIDALQAAGHSVDDSA